MLDIESYRAEEDAAKSAISNWRLTQTHNLDMFEKTGFPVRVKNLAQTRQLIDTMQEDRFEAYQNELGGLTVDEIELFVDACADIVSFQRIHYPHHAPRLALDTLMGMLASYRKITVIKPDFRSILEVGPGCGYLASFLKHHFALETYALTESCESFYLLQHYLNSYPFGEEFLQTIGANPVGSLFTAETGPLAQFLTTEFDLPKPSPRVFQYPWWRLGELVENHTFDIAVSNANFMEFTPEALSDYLALFKKVLTPEGVIVCQCFGFESTERNRDYLLNVLQEARLAPVHINWGGHPKARGFWESRMKGGCDFIQPGDDRRFIVANRILATESHPQYEEFMDNGEYSIHATQDDPMVKAFFQSAEGRKLLTKDEAAGLVVKRLECG